MEPITQHTTTRLASLDPQALSRSTAASAPAAEKSEKKGFSFWDFVDIINPLQHIPVVNTLYRAITGDTIRPEAKLAGGGLFGGPIGLALAAADVVVEEETGKDTGAHVMALFNGTAKGKDHAPTMVAQNLPALSEGQLQLIAQSMNRLEPAADKKENQPRVVVAANRREAAYEAALRRMADLLAAHQTLDSATQKSRVEVRSLPPL